MSHNTLAATLLFILLCATASAEVITVEVGFDRWNYPFNSTPGTRATGSVFGAIGSEAFDDRDAQVILGFDVSTVGPPSPDLTLTAVTLRLTTAGADTFVYDPTFDPPSSYTTGTDPDEGRPLELYGVGTRNGFSGLTLDGSSTDPSLFKESSPYSPTPGVFRSVRSVFAADVTGDDVSNNISNSQEVTPWAIGQAESLAPGSSVPLNTEFRFAIDMTDSEIANYVDAGLSADNLFFALTSLHGASRDGPPTFPSFFLDAGGVSLGQTALLDFEYSPVPEPGSLTLALLGIGLFVALYRK